MKNLAFVTLIVLAVSIANGNSARAEGFFDAPGPGSVYVHVPDPAPASNRDFFASIAPPSSSAKPTVATKPDQKTDKAAETTSDADEPGDFGDENSVLADPKGPAPMYSEKNISYIQRCQEYAPLFQKLIGKYCKADTKIKPKTVCGVWLEEGKPKMCLGATRGEVCENSNARPPAEGPLQCLRSTAQMYGAGASYNPQLLEDSADCGVHYLCDLEQKVGEQKMFMAYQSGPAGDFSREKPQTYNREVRDRVAMFEGGGNIPSSSGVHIASPYLIGIAPIDPGLAYIGSIYGDPRDHGPHMGMDWRADPGTPTKAPFDAVVIFSGWSPSVPGKRCGGQITMQVGNGAIGSVVLVRFCHLGEVTVKAGDHVIAGQVVGKVGAKGERSAVFNSFPHLHWEVHEAVSGNGGHITTKPLQIFAWVNLAPYDPKSPFYKGPVNPDSNTVAERFRKMSGEAR